MTDELPHDGALPCPAGPRRRSPAALQVLVSDTLTRLTQARNEAVDAAVRSELQRIVDFFELDRCVLLRSLKTSGDIEVRYQTHGVGQTALPDLSHFEDNFIRALEKAVKVMAPISIVAPAKKIAEASIESQRLPVWNTGAMLLLPIATDGEDVHLVCLVSRRRGRILSLAQTHGVQMLCEAIVSTLRRRDLESARAEALRFERLVADLSSGLAGAGNNEIDRQIDVSLQQLLTFTDADQCGIFTMHELHGPFCLTHLASRRVTLPQGSVIDCKTLLPWIWNQLVMQRKMVVFSNPQELPPEAATDRLYLINEVQTHSATYIPYAADGATMYFLAIVFSQGRQHRWAEPFLDRFQALGWTFVGALSRAKTATAYAQAQQQLIASRRLAVATLNALQEYLCIVDADGTIVEISEAWRNLGAVAGISPAEVAVGTHLLSAYDAAQPPHDLVAGKMAAGLRAVLDGSTTTFEMASSHPTSTGLQWLKSSIWRFGIDDLTYAAIGLLDITEQRRKEEELAELRAQHWHAERVTRTGVLVASLAHELSQPLAAILSNAQAGLRFLRNDAPPAPQEFRELLGDIVADDKRAAKVIESLRLMLRRQKSDRAPVDMADIVRNVVSMLHSELMRLHVALEQRCAQGCIAVVDQAQMLQVLLNLITNGMEAMENVAEDRRHLRLTVAPTPEGNVRIEVSDTGVGLSPTQIEKAFQAFWTTKQQGTGLGLAVCQSIVRAHGGRIWVEANEGPGLTLLITLPGAAPIALTAQTNSRQAT